MPFEEDLPVLAAIRRLLAERRVAYRKLTHEPTFTSEQAARARGEPLEIGGKALVIKVDGVFRLFVLSAARELRSASIRRHLGARRTRFATRDELLELTGLEPGCVPPFGRPILPLDLYADFSVLEREWIAFNPGSHVHSIVLATADWRELARPEVFRFSC